MCGTYHTWRGITMRQCDLTAPVYPISASVLLIYSIVNEIASSVSLFDFLFIHVIVATQRIVASLYHPLMMAEQCISLCFLKEDVLSD